MSGPTAAATLAGVTAGVGVITGSPAVMSRRAAGTGTPDERMPLPVERSMTAMGHQGTSRTWPAAISDAKARMDFGAPLRDMKPSVSTGTMTVSPGDTVPDGATR